MITVLKTEPRGHAEAMFSGLPMVGLDAVAVRDAVKVSLPLDYCFPKGACLGEKIGQKTWKGDLLAH